MATITLYSLSKRTNSTKRPAAATPKLVLTGEWRAPFSVISPVITIEVSAGNDLITDGYNIAYVSDTGRYYWIEDIVFQSKSIADIHLQEDYLASYKTTIGNSSQFVSRASSLKNGYYTDSMYPISNRVTCEDDDISSELPWSLTGNIEDGYYVVGIINQADTTLGATSYYVMDQAEFQYFRNQLFSSVTYTNMQFTQIEPALYKSLWNPLQYVVSCMWFPMKPPTSIMDSLLLNIGYFEVPFLLPTPPATTPNIWRLGATAEVYTGGSLQTINHPMISEGTYFNAAPFTFRKLILQPYGEIPLDCNRILDTNHTLEFTIWVDFITGDSMIKVYETSNIGGPVVVGGSVGQVGIPIQLAQVQQSPLAIASAGVQAYYNKITSSWESFLIDHNMHISQHSQDTGFLAAMEPKSLTRASEWVQNKVSGLHSQVQNAVQAGGTTMTTLGTNGSLLNSICPAYYDLQF